MRIKALYLVACDRERRGGRYGDHDHGSLKSKIEGLGKEVVNIVDTHVNFGGDGYCMSLMVSTGPRNSLSIGKIYEKVKNLTDEKGNKVADARLFHRYSEK